MKRTLAVGLQHLLPQKLLCAFIYKVARCRARWFKDALIRWFAAQYRVDLEEAARPSLGDYESFNDFFTRALKSGARTIESEERALVSPVDGTLTQFGTLGADRLVQAKGMDYSLHELLGERSAASHALQDGEFATIYLAPHNYHRVHAPLPGRWIRARYLAGARFSVNALTASAVPGLFTRNERLVCWFDGPVGPYALVLVGALNVSSMSTVTRGEIPSGPGRQWDEAAAAPFKKGDEIGRFNLGSTIVLVLPPGAVRWNATTIENRGVVMGEALATLANGD